MLRHITLLLLSLISLSVNAQELDRKWIFESITSINDTTPLRTIGTDDYMLINDDGTFKYEIASIPLKATGSWSMENKVLQFDYNFPNDTSRYYDVSLSTNSLVLTENNINYAFTTSLQDYKND